MTFTEIDQDTTQARICYNTTGWWEEYRYREECGQLVCQCIFDGILSGTNTPYEQCRNENKNIILYAGTVTEGNGSGITCDSSPVCKSLYVFCGLDPKERFATISTISGDGSANLQLNCQGTHAIGTLHIIAFIKIENEASRPSENDIQLNGSLPKSFTMIKDYYDNNSRVYRWEGSMEWTIPVNQSCGSTVSLAASANGFAEVYLSSIDFKEQGNCELYVNLSPSEIFPNGAGSPVSSNVTATVVCPVGVPVSGYQVNFETEILESRGHAHSNKRSPGIIGGSCITDDSGTCNVNYYASTVAGRDKTTASLASAPEITDSKEIKIWVPDLEPLGSSIVYNLTGAPQGSSHPANHYGTPSTNGTIYNVAFDYLYKTYAMLGINDMSLEWGGLFDIGPPKYPYWSPPHNLHRVGKSVDIDSKAQDTGTNGYVDVKRPLLEEIMTAYDGVRVREATIHYELP